MKKNFNQHLQNLLKTQHQFCDKEGELLKQNIRHSAEQFDNELIKLLFNNQETKQHFFKQVSGAIIVFNYRKFIDYIGDKNFLMDSYTKFSNKVGLTVSNKHIKQIDNVVLSFPFKDCILEGGQSKDNGKRREVFFNEILAKDEINRLLDKKVIARAKKYAQDGISDTPAFSRDKNGTIKDNLVIKGNNLLALHTLKSNFAAKVKLIYIDPPYNTGNDSFNYNDNFNHSTWLVFMKNRLEVAKELLADDGVIFVQCDDNEQAYLKVLMDDIFGRDNFVADFIWHHRKSSQNDIDVSLSHNYTLTFAKNRTVLTLNSLAIDNDKFANRDDDPRGDWVADPFDAPNIRKNLSYEIINPNTKTVYLPPEGRCWRMSEEKYKQALTGNRIVFGKSGKTKPQYKRFKSEAEEKGTNTFTIWNDTGTATEGTKELMALFNGKKFTTPKPEKLLQRIIEIATKSDDIVLDYHLGSGTTCAVAHKMGRQYIGIEQMDYIEDIAVKRMQKVINGEQGGISKAVDYQGGGEFIYFELDKYNQKYIDNLHAIRAGHKTAKMVEQLYDEIAEHAFLNYDVETKKLLENKKDFEALSLDKQLESLFSILNKNLLYKNLTEIDDETLEVDNKTKQLNKDFYQ